MSKRNELSYDPQRVHDWQNLFGEARVDGPYGALAAAKPGAAVALSADELLALREVIVDAIDQLAPAELAVFDRWVIERMTLRAIATELQMSRTTVWRTKNRAIETLRTQLADEPLVRDYLKR